MGRTVLRIVDSNATLLVLLLANFFLLELIDDPRWGALLSTLLAALALVVAISDPDAGTTITKRHAVSIAACVVLAPIVLFVNSESVVGLTYLLPVVLLVTATLPVTISRTLQHRRITHETVFGALCAYVLVGLLFAFVYLAVDELRDGSFFAQEGPHSQSEFVYYSFVSLTTLGSAISRPRSAGAAGADRARGTDRPDLPRHAGRAARDALGPPERACVAVLAWFANGNHVAEVRSVSAFCEDPCPRGSRRSTFGGMSSFVRVSLLIGILLAASAGSGAAAESSPWHWSRARTSGPQRAACLLFTSACPFGSSPVDGSRRRWRCGYWSAAKGGISGAASAMRSHAVAGAGLERTLTPRRLSSASSHSVRGGPAPARSASRPTARAAVTTSGSSSSAARGRAARVPLG